MKTLANCSPKEFLVQTNRIRKFVKKWLDDTKILEYRKQLPDIPEGATKEQKQKITLEKARENISAMFDAALDEHPDETAELLGLLCFIEPEDLDKHTMTELFAAFDEIINCKEIYGFFTSLTQLVQTNTSNTAKA